MPAPGKGDRAGEPSILPPLPGFGPLARGTHSSRCGLLSAPPPVLRFCPARFAFPDSPSAFPLCRAGLADGRYPAQRSLAHRALKG